MARLPQIGIEETPYGPRIWVIESALLAVCARYEVDITPYSAGKQGAIREADAGLKEAFTRLLKKRQKK